MAETIRAAYDRWKKADEEWVEATLDLAKQLYEARQQHASNEDFSIWLDKNGLQIQKNTRAAFIVIGEHFELAKVVLRETESRSVRLVSKELENRLPSAGNTDSTEPKSPPATTNKRKREKAAKQSGKREIKKAAKEKSFVENLLAQIKRKRKEAHDVKITRRWRPEGINKLELINLLDWVEKQLNAFIDGRIDSLESDTSNNKLRLVESAASHVEESQRRVGEFDA